MYDVDDDSDHDDVLNYDNDGSCGVYDDFDDDDDSV
jgi:hypothetical protein